MVRARPRLERILDRLAAAFGEPQAPQPESVLGHVLLENVAYLASDAHRLAAMQELRARTDLLPQRVLALTVAELTAITKVGGIHAADRAVRLQEAARLALQDFDGDADAILRLPLAEALAALQRFPAIGRPGAEKILLFTGTAPLLALESNGLRALLRLGYGSEHKGYDKSYREAQQAAAAELPETCAARQRAFALLREVGRRTCLRAAPDCAPCPARSLCPVGQG